MGVAHNKGIRSRAKRGERDVIDAPTDMSYKGHRHVLLFFYGRYQVVVGPSYFYIPTPNYTKGLLQFLSRFPA